MFPLPEKAAVDHLLMRVGERTIEGQIREREQAKAEYEQARERGAARRASSSRSGRTSSRRASPTSAPARSSSVEIELQQTLAFDEGEVRLRFPLVVGPRYIPGPEIAGRPRRASAGRRTPTPSPTPPASRRRCCRPARPPRNPVAIEVDLDAGFPVEKLLSRYHAVVTRVARRGPLPRAAARRARPGRPRLRARLDAAARDACRAAPSSARSAGELDLRARDPLPAGRARGRGRPPAARGRLRDRHLRLDGGPLDPAGAPGARCSRSTACGPATAST